MKLLMFQARSFSYKPFLKTLPEAPDKESEKHLSEVAMIFVHVESDDEHRRDKLVTRAVKNIKWLANKRGLKTIVLHSFTHLSDSKADTHFANALLEDVAQRLRKADYAVAPTPFGYTCEWRLEVYGDSIAKVFKAL